MKKICLLAFTAIVWLAAADGYGQTVQSSLKRTPAEQAAFEKSVTVNPAKISAGSPADPKMDPAAPNTGPVKWKAEPAPSDGRKICTSSPPVPTRPAKPELPAVKSNQPQGNLPGGPQQNFNSVNGPTTQPAGEKPGSDNHHPGGQGTAKQSAGDNPGKK
jgi:hypothetical protein